MILSLLMVMMGVFHQTWVIYPPEANVEPPTTIEKLIECESGGDKWAINHNEPHGKSYGIMQFRLETFQEQGRLYDLPHNDIFSEEQQIAIASRMLLDGKGNRWSCY